MYKNRADKSNYKITFILVLTFIVIFVGIFSENDFLNLLSFIAIIIFPLIHELFKWSLEQKFQLNAYMLINALYGLSLFLNFREQIKFGFIGYLVMTFVYLFVMLLVYAINKEQNNGKASN